MTDGPFRHVQKPRRHRRPPLLKPWPRPHRLLPLPRTERPLTPIDTARVSRAALESSLRARIPGVAGVNFREQKSCLQTMRNFETQRLRCKPGLKLSLKEGACPGRSRPPGSRSADFSTVQGLLFPRQRADKSHACTRASKSRRRQKPPDPPPNKETGRKKANSIKEGKSERSAREPSFPRCRRGARTDPAPNQPPGAVARPGRLLCAPNAGSHCWRSPSRPGYPPASAVRTLSCRRQALCTERLPGRRKSTCHFLNCLQLVPLTDLGQAASARRCRRAVRPRLRELGGAVRAASRPGRPACLYEVQCAQPPVGGELGGEVTARLRQDCRVSSEPAPQPSR